MPNAAGMTSAQASNAMDASMGASAFTALAGGFENAAALKAQGSYASSIANTNASLANLKAQQTLQAGDVAASRKALETESAVGSARAAGGASGVDVNRGSPAMTQAGITTAGNVDVATIRSNAARAAWGYQTQATQEQYAGQIQELTGRQRAIQSIATGGIQAVAGPLGMYSQAALWQYRYGGRGTPGMPFPSTSNGSSDSSDFWDQG